MPRVTLQTIADHVGVSRMTVSNAFSRPDQLSELLRQRILEVAQELGYAGPDPTARALARGSTGAIGVLLTDSLSYAFTDEVATRFLGSIVEELAPTGLALTLLTSDERSGSTTARDIAIDGAIVYSCRPRSAAREWLRRRKLPIVDVDQDPDPEIPSVNVDDRGGARAGAAHLVELGHQRIAVLTAAVPLLEPEMHAESAEPLRHHPQRERFAGWMDALSAAGIGPAVRVVTEYTVDHAANVIREVLLGDDRPTAVLCYSDLLALGVLRAARDIGLDVPADLSVVGFDDSPAARQSLPALTTVRQDVVRKGQLAAAALVEAIEHSRNGEKLEIHHELLPTELVERASAGPARQVGHPSTPGR